MRFLLPIFPYKLDVSGNFFPVIPVLLGSGDRRKRFLALIDSGATVSIFRSEVADQLGIDIEKGEEVYLGGVGGRIKGYIHKIKVEVAKKRFTCPVVFSREYLVSFNLLGRKVFFKKFKITFNEKRRLVELN